MALTTDIWAVTPSFSATLYRAAAAIAGAGDITLLTNQPLDNGAGYKILFTCAGDATPELSLLRLLLGPIPPLCFFVFCLFLLNLFLLNLFLLNLFLLSLFLLL